jgi:hypothetical protein
MSMVVPPVLAIPIVAMVVVTPMVPEVVPPIVPVIVSVIGTRSPVGSTKAVLPPVVDVQVDIVANVRPARAVVNHFVAKVARANKIAGVAAIPPTFVGDARPGVGTLEGAVGKGAICARTSRAGTIQTRFVSCNIAGKLSGTHDRLVRSLHSQEVAQIARRGTSTGPGPRFARQRCWAVFSCHVLPRDISRKSRGFTSIQTWKTSWSRRRFAGHVAWQISGTCCRAGAGTWDRNRWLHGAVRFVEIGASCTGAIEVRHPRGRTIEISSATYVWLIEIRCGAEIRSVEIGSAARREIDVGPIEIAAAAGRHFEVGATTANSTP